MTAVALLSGIALFVYGMLLLSDAMKRGFSEKLTEKLARFTSNRFSAVLTGTAFTALMQSSSASSVMTVSLVDAGKIPVMSAFWIIVGANIGSVFTGFLTAIEFSDIAPLFCCAGVLILCVSKKEKTHSKAFALLGFGLLFVGMNTMSQAVSGLRSDERILNILGDCTNPFSGIVCGTALTAVLQSSAAITALLQTLAAGGVIGLREAFFISLGSNIGTCLTSLISAVSVNNTAKKVALFHLLFNIFSALLFVILCVPFDLVSIIDSLLRVDIKTQIAAVNMLFNLVPAVFMLCAPVQTIRDFIRKMKPKKQKRLNIRINAG